MTFDRKKLERNKKLDALKQSEDRELNKLALDFVVHSDKYNYGYQWTWLDLPIIQLPQDIIVTQEIIWENKPDIIIETGVAWGGSILLYASLMELHGAGKVIGVDLNLNETVESKVMSYPFSNRIVLYKGSSIELEMFEKIKSHIESGMKVMVILDSNHTHSHVFEELKKYAPLVSKGQYLIVSDTIVEEIPEQSHRPRPWGHGNNPKTALKEYLGTNDCFEEDVYINKKLLATFTPSGYLKCIKD